MSDNNQLITGTLIILLVTTVVTFGLGYSFVSVALLGGETTNPQADFEAHIQALADGEWELAHSYFAEGCSVAPWEIERAFKDGLDPDNWRVDKVFLEEDEALLWFARTGGVQYMVVEEGEWRISCDEEIR